MKPPYVKIIAQCSIHGQLSDERKPNKLKDRPKGREGLYDAIRCTRCGTGLEIILGAKITAVSAAACELRRNGFDMECIKQNNPPIYRLNNPDEAWEKSKELLERKAA